MKFSAFCLFIFTFTLTTPLWAQTGDATAGQAKAAFCIACHGMDGVGTVPLHPNIGGQGEKYLYKQILEIKEGTRAVALMQPFTLALSDQDILDLAAYYSAQPKVISGSAEIENVAFDLDAAEYLALGESIYRAGNLENGVPACTGCHSPTGEGNFPAGYPSLSGQKSEYLIKQLLDFQNNIRTNDGDNAVMRGVVARMTALEIEAVANFISGLH